MKSVLWRVAKYLSYIEEARCLKVNPEYPNKTYVPARSDTITFDTLCPTLQDIVCSYFFPTSTDLFSFPREIIFDKYWVVTSTTVLSD